MRRHHQVHGQGLLYHVMARGNDGRTKLLRIATTKRFWSDWRRRDSDIHQKAPMVACSI
jgi:hypothetical protein